MQSGKIISIAFPDTYVRYSESFVQEKLFPLVGLGAKGYIKAGHALLLLVENKTGNIYYYDFGRYVTPPKHGRVRSFLTDAELEIPIKAIVEKEAILNIEDILLWLAAHPEKTHGSGRLVASICHDINFDKADSFLRKLQSKGSIPYKTFGDVGSNCSRLVTDTLIQASASKKVTIPLKRNNLFTPSPLGNVKYGANGSDIYVVDNDTCNLYNASLRKEIICNYFDTEKPASPETKITKAINGNLHYLDGIGAGAYFEISEFDNNYLIKRFDEDTVLNFKGVFKSNQNGFELEKKYKFIYDSNCLYCHIEQNNKIYRFDLLNKISL